MRPRYVHAPKWGYNFVDQPTEQAIELLVEAKNTDKLYCIDSSLTQMSAERLTLLLW